MSGFKSVHTSEQLNQGYDDRPHVYLESNDDYQIIAQRWFRQDMKAGAVRFIPADSEADGGGCGAVIQLVDKYRQKGVSAYGIVDRDVLKSLDEWDLWWEEDDAVFLAARPCGAYVRVLLRWELENYLLDVETMETVAADTPPLSADRAPDVAANDFLRFAGELKDKSAATVTLMIHKKRGLKPGFGCPPILAGEELSAALEAQLAKESITDPAAKLRENRIQIDRFDRPATAGVNRWERLTRMLDGKAALKYLGCALGTPFDKKCGELARRMGDAGRIPAEIRGYIEEFKRGGEDGVV